MPCYGVRTAKAPLAMITSLGHLRQGIFLSVQKSSLMFNKPTESASADDPRCLAYGRQVKELLNAADAATWCDHLWEMYGGFMLAQPELGFNPRSADIFSSFRDLLFFFERLKEGERKAG